MKQLLILGAGNIGKIIYEYALLSSGYNRDWIVKGFLDFTISDKNVDSGYPFVVDTIDTYQPREEDVFICSYANVGDRKKSIEMIEQKGGRFINIIHPTANICRTASLGVGNLIGAFTTLSINSHVGDHVIVQDHCNLGHDVIIGDFSHLYVGNIICGLNQLGTLVTVYTGSTVYPKIKIGNNAIIGAGSVVMRGVKDNATVIGNPAKNID